jgi:hypothetical protein
MLGAMAATNDAHRRRRRALLAGAATLALALALAPGAGAASGVSSNWGGWVALGSSGSHQSFRSVSGSWRVPRVSCTAGQTGYSAVWVGLGGYRHSSNALEQIGTDADCSHSGHAHYDSWFELIPAAPVSVPLSTHPGDAMTASVTVAGHHVTLRMRDARTGAHYSTTRRAGAVDTSSADWILEAPSNCENSGCQTLALSDFGTVSFLSATATSGSHTGPVQDPSWSAASIELRQGSHAGYAGYANGRAQGASSITATPSAPQGELGAFTVTWGEGQLRGESPVPRAFGEALQIAG